MRANGHPVRIHAIIDGTKYDVGPVKASEADRLLAWTGYSSLREWEGNVVEGDPLACRALVALFSFRRGEHVKMSDVDIDDVAGIEGSTRLDDGRLVDVVRGEDGAPILTRGAPTWVFDGEVQPNEHPPAAASQEPSS